ncbi:MAG TPA: TadE/TadG family type IV pilus assembly protein [Candidatus Bathyarchaeia archaeon]|nr:TadE/TadG family type IV pilus assembly protein [Candidatus Bathyarchaeia archaeon]
MGSQLQRGEKGQILVWVAIALPILVLFTALAVDMTLIYMDKARLANAVDSAVLTGVRNYSAEGQATAQNLAGDMFVANYGSSAPALTYTWCTAADTGCNGAVSLTVQAGAPHNTYFMKILPNLAMWQLGDTATASRSNLVMTIVLDRSGSMCGGTIPCVDTPPGYTGNDGGMALQAAVPTFIGNFVPNVDQIALVSFSSNSTLDVPMTTSFRTAIDNDVANMQFVGGTFGGGAGTNSCTGTCLTGDGPPLNMADNQNNSVVLGQNQPETKVVVYFTDGLMNAIQDWFHCGGKTSANMTLLNYGGQDPTNGSYSCPGGVILDPTQPANAFACALQGFNGFYYDNNGDICVGANGNNVTTFPSQQYGTQETFSQAAITTETQWRALYTATQMRQESPSPTYIFTIGLGTGVSGSVPTEAFLSTLANDPNGPSNYAGAVYDSSLPAGLFVVVPDCPSSVCTQELTTAFQTIASRILLRLSQ